MSKYKKQLIILLLIVIELTSIFFAYKSFSNKEVTSLKETTKIDKKRFAMYVENIEGKYEEVSDMKFNGRYLLNQEKTTCVDNKGNALKNVISYNHNQVTVTSNKTLFCYLYFDIKIDIQVDVETDGETGVVPTTLGYTKLISCEDGTSPTWNYKYNRLEFTGINSDETKCKLTYTKDTNTYENLRDVVESDPTIYHETYAMREFDKGKLLTESEYNVLEKYYSSGASDTASYGTEITNELAFVDGKWKFQTDTLIERFYYLKLGVNEPGYYQLCYELSSGYSLNMIRYISFNGKNIALNGTSTSLSASSDQNKSGCFDLGYLTSEDYVKTVFDPYTSTSGETSDYNIYLQKAYMLDQYRYNGQNPDNYLWFNNELWRIIGSIPTKISEDGTTENLIKIIKNDSLGDYAYNDQSSNSMSNGYWGNNSLYILLNEYYLGKKNGNTSGYCWGHGSINSSSSSNAMQNCDYRTIGLSENYYGNLIEKVYWNTGKFHSDNECVFDVFYGEGEIQTIYNYVGIMNASDYIYAGDESYYSIAADDVSDGERTKNNWLYQGNEWTNTFDSYKNPVSINGNGALYVPSTSSDLSYTSRKVRPVLYLKTSTKIISGDGSIMNPYLIAE